MSSTTVPNPANGSFPSRSSRLSTGCSAVGHYHVPPGQMTNFDPIKKKGKRWRYYTVGAACSVVEVDVLTGQHSLLSTEIPFPHEKTPFQ